MPKTASFYVLYTRTQSTLKRMPQADQIKFPSWIFSITGVAILAMIFATGCELLGDDPTPGIGDVDVISYQNHIQSIFDQRCTSCHGEVTPDVGLRLDGWTWLIQGSDFGEAIIPFSGDESLMIKMLDPSGPNPHPLDVGRDRLSEDEFGLLKRWVNEGAVGPLGSSPFASSLNLLYVTHESSPVITVMDTDAWLVVRRVDLEDFGFTSRARAHHVAVEPDGSFWYVSVGSLASSDAQGILKFNRQNELVGQYQTDNPGLIALHPNQDAMYVSRTQTSSDPRSLLELRRSDMLAVDIPVTFAAPHALAIRPFGDFLFSSSIDVDLMMIVSLANLDVQYYDIQGVKQEFNQFAISPDGSRMWGVGSKSNSVSLFDISDPNNIVQRQSIQVGGSPRDLTFVPDGSSLYVTVPDANRVIMLNANLGVVDAIVTDPGIQGPAGIATSSDGKYIFVSNQNLSGAYPARHSVGNVSSPGLVSIIDTSTNKVVKVVEVSPEAGLMGSRFVVPTFVN